MTKSEFDEFRSTVQRETTQLQRDLSQMVQDFEKRTGIPVFIAVDTSDTKSIGSSVPSFVQRFMVKPVL